MSEETVAQFLQKVAEDPGLQAELKAASESQEPVAAIVAAAARHSYTFTAEEFTKVQDRMRSELSEEELSRMTGGLGIVQLIRQR